MNSIVSASQLFLPLAYLVLAIDYWLIFLRRHPLAERLGPPLLLATLCLHLAHLFAQGARWQQLPIADVPQALSLVAFSVALVYGVVEWIGDERSTGVWMVSLALLLQVLASLFADGAPPPALHLFRSSLFVLHVCFALLGYAAAMVAGSYGFLFLSLYHELKSGRFRLFFGRLPPLEVLDRMMSGALAVSFLGLSGAVASGLAWGLRSGAGVVWKDPEILFTIVLCLAFGAALALRRLRRWQGRQIAFVSLGGLAMVLLSLIASNFLSQGFHPF